METLPPPVDDSEPTTTALFSLQVSVDAASYSPPLARSSAGPATECLVAFQLLKFDIVLFDDGVLSQAEQRWRLTQAQGQSCLFECDTHRLAQDIRDDESVALVLLVLQREDQKARLVAFACVRLELPHLAFSGDHKRPRVSEWAAANGTWPLVNHQNQSVGSITGTVTLSCLGRALAPHLIAQRFGQGLHVLGKASSPRAASSPRSSVYGSEFQRKETTRSDSSQAERLSVQGDAGDQRDSTEAKAPSLKKTSLPPSPELKSVDQTKDAAVQCASDDEDESFVSGTRSPKPILIRGSSRDLVSCSPSRRRVVDEFDHMDIGSHGSLRTPRSTHDRSPRPAYISYTRETPRQRGDREAAAVGPFSQDPELPPPLYFHKPKQHKT